MHNEALSVEPGEGRAQYPAQQGIMQQLPSLGDILFRRSDRGGGEVLDVLERGGNRTEVRCVDAAMPNVDLGKGHAQCPTQQGIPYVHNA